MATAACAAEAQAAKLPEEGVSSVKSRVCIVHSKQLLELSEKNPRFTGRGRLVHSLIEAYGLLSKLRVLEPQLATKKELQAFHSSAYLHFLDTHNNHNSAEDDDLLLFGAESEEMDVFGLGYDCPLFAGVFEYVRATAGSSLTAASALVNGEASVVLNWYGGWHHGRKDEASGFCYCNDIVLAILKLQEKFQRVLYVDIDLHHGDGVEDAFYHSPRVMTVSLHKYCGPGFFPGTGGLDSVGSGKGKYHCVNVPLGDGIKDEQYEKIFKRVLSEVKLSFDPHVVVMQCGADMLSGDPVGSFCLTPEGVGKRRYYHDGVTGTLALLRMMSEGYRKDFSSYGNNSPRPLGMEITQIGHLTYAMLYRPIGEIPLETHPDISLYACGYHFSNTARLWTYCTALTVGEVLSYEIPDHDHFEHYGPGYELYFTAASRPNENPQKKIENILQTITQHLSNIHSPSDTTVGSDNIMPVNLQK